MAADDAGLAGQLIASRYRIGTRIGEGGMGVVYGAFDEQLRRPVAIKFLPPARQADDDRLGRFRNEARTLSALNHPHIVTIFEIGQTDTTPFIAMELVEGETLRARLRAGRLPLRDALDIALQVARALGAAHEKGIVHRDIKPENVMIRRDGYVKVLDFGVAILRAREHDTPSMLTGGSLETVIAGVAGTPAYMSPEQIDGRPLDARSDLFSLGVLLCEMVTGTNPFAGGSVVDTIGAIQRTPAPAASLTAGLPRDARDIVLRLLQRDPADRYHASRDLETDLRNALGTIDMPARGQRGRSARRRGIAIAAALALMVAAGSAAVLYRSSERRHWVREQAIPEIARLAAGDKAVQAFQLIQEAEKYAPADPDLARAVASATRVATVHSTPPGALVEVEDYLSPASRWIRLGTTPLDKVRLPAGYLRWKVSKPDVGELITAPAAADTMDFDLETAAKAPEGMVPVSGGPWIDSLAFLGWVGPYALPPFFIDRFEVTNRQYQVFVDKGGYTTPDYWKQPFVRDGRERSWSEAMDLFRDATGRPGPSTWEGGHYPEGKADYPVSGVSWFEAAAYAEFMGNSLPVIAQGYKTMPPVLDRFAVAESNLSGSPAPVGQFAGLGPFGTLDLIGNVREWYWNAANDDLRYTLGRQANSYGPEALSPFDRSALNGFRCVRNSGPVPEEARAARVMLRRDFSTARPVDDAAFKIYRDMYAYDRTPLNATSQAMTDPSVDWTREKVTFTAAYGGERISAYLFLPKNTKPPFQSVVFFPSARVNFLSSSADLGDMSFVDYVIKSGRAVIYPVYQKLYERRSTTVTLPGPTLQRATLVDWRKDVGRSIDYLETRDDIDKSRIAYLGVSQGSAYGVVIAALEDRFKAVVFLDGGMFQQTAGLAGLDQVDFAPRLTKPVLMVNGRYDATFPYESAQLPLFRMLGTAAANKRHVVFDTPHDVRLRRTDLVREVLDWYDKYLGRVQ
jgi:formylglycine-generating enzyme required for sulfatase activity/dienelactone hydrolase